MATIAYDDPSGDRDERLARLAFWTKLLRILLIVGIPTVCIDAIFAASVVSGQLQQLDYATLTSIDTVLIPLNWASIVVLFCTLVVFGRWIYLAATNLIAENVEGFEYTAGWCVGWYFIPFANLVKPFQAMRQIWNGSTGNGGPNIDDGHATLTTWWASWLVAGIAGNMSFRLLMSADTPESVVTGYMFSLVSALANLVCYPVALKIVQRINGAQQDGLELQSVFD